MINKENNVFKDGIGVKGLRFKLHGNNHGNHLEHYGIHHDNHGNHHSNQGNRVIAVGSWAENIGNFCLLYLQFPVRLTQTSKGNNSGTICPNHLQF